MRTFLRKRPLLIRIAVMTETDVLGSHFFLKPPFIVSTTKVTPWSFSAGHPCRRKDFQLPAEVSSEASVGEARVWKAMSLSRGCILPDQVGNVYWEPLPRPGRSFGSKP
jgi:hypothetical protein